MGAIHGFGESLEEGCVQAQTSHTRPPSTRAIHKSTKHQRPVSELYTKLYHSYRRQRSLLLHIVRLEACKLHSVNLSLHSQPLIHPTLPHSPVSRWYSTFPWCLCICAVSNSPNGPSFTQSVSTFVAFNPFSTCLHLSAIGSLFIPSATTLASLQHQQQKSHRQIRYYAWLRFYAKIFLFL